MGLASRLARIVADNAAREGCDCILLSGGVDTGFIAAALALEAGAKPRAYTVLPPEPGPDDAYALYTASRLGLPHKLSRLDPSRLQWAVDLALQAELTVDPVEVAGAAATAAALAMAAGDGCRCVLTGDGGDELFLGYDFLARLPPRELDGWRRRMASGAARFSSDAVASSLRARVCHPLYSPEACQLALEAPLRCLRSSGWGKLLMRLYLEAAGLSRLAWRPKTPVTHGSGALLLLEQLSREARPIEGWEPSRPHAFLLRRLHALGLRPPPPCPSRNRACPVCGRCLDGSHCRFCGAWLGEGGVSVYKGRQLSL